VILLTDTDSAMSFICE